MFEKINKLFEKYYVDNNFSGAGIVRKGDEVIYSKAFGYAHRGFKVENTVDTMFDTASVTKLFTAVAALQLVDKGLLSFEDKITEIIDLKGTKIPEDVTVFHLLTHTSGIADDADEEAGENYEDLFIDKPCYSLRNCKDFLPQFAYKEPNFKAGTEVRYNNCAFILIGLAIEKLTGMNYQKYVEENVFKAAGMKNTAFSAKDEGDKNIAEGYFSVVDKETGNIIWVKNIYSYPPVGTADGGAFTSVVDLDIFIRSLKEGKLLSEKLTKAILSPSCDIERPCRKGKIINGYGFHFLYNNEDKLISIFKEGMNVGVRAMTAYYPSIDTTSIILGNQDCNIWKLHTEIEELLFEEVEK